MKKKEKTEYIIEQMRICLLKKDYIRTQIISRKIHPKVLLDADEGFQKIKIRFHELMVQFFAHNRSYLDIAKAYFAIYETPIVQKDSAQALNALKLVAVFVILSEKSNEQSDFLNRIALDTNLAKIPAFQRLVDLLITKEVLDFAEFRTEFSPEFAPLPAFAGKDDSNALWEDLRLRIIEHNLHVISAYYKLITTKRLAQLLNLDQNESELQVSKLVVKGAIYAKIDRPRGVISFRKTETPNEVLNKWGADIAALLDLVEHTVHLIQRENMVHKVVPPASSS